MDGSVAKFRSIAYLSSAQKMVNKAKNLRNDMARLALQLVRAAETHSKPRRYREVRQAFFAISKLFLSLNATQKSRFQGRLMGELNRSSISQKRCDKIKQGLEKVFAGRHDTCDVTKPLVNSRPSSRSSSISEYNEKNYKDMQTLGRLIADWH